MDRINSLGLGNASSLGRIYKFGHLCLGAAERAGRVLDRALFEAAQPKPSPFRLGLKRPGSGGAEDYASRNS
jgi:hypothetical protein